MIWLFFHKLKKFLTFDEKFNETIVKEFYATISKNIGKTRNSFIRRTYVGGGGCLITSNLFILKNWLGMYEVLEASDEKLCNDVVSLELTDMNWPDKIENLLASKLLSKGKVLFKNLINNLDPLTHRFDMCQEEQ